MRQFAIRASLLALLVVGEACGPAAPPPATAPAPQPSTTVVSPALAGIQHIVILYLENRSFDNLYGEFAGADGIVGLPPARYQQIDSAGRPYATLSQAPDSKLPPTIRNAPFPIEDFIPSNAPTRDLVHRFYHEQAQIGDGRMNKFALVSDALGLTMGYYHTASLPLAAIAKEFTLADRFFHGAFGGSFLNHIYLISAAVPSFLNAPDTMRARIANGILIRDGAVSPDGFVVNTAFSVSSPRPPWAQAGQLVPLQTMATIGDRLSDKRISWAWYSGGWDDAIAGRPDSLFQFHHQPFIYFANYADGTPGRAAHLKDEREFISAARAGTLPAVSFVKPVGANNEHPGYADLVSGERHTVELIDAVRNGPNWKDALIIVTYDENGGFWDHVAPPKIDKWGPGTRIPTIVISPFARRGYVDHTTYDTSSILALIEHRFGLAPLGSRDASANDLTAALSPTAR
ncbi:MAG: alkaline phosphatase family protein [Gemmatimonadales bacterium]